MEPLGIFKGKKTGKVKTKDIERPLPVNGEFPDSDDVATKINREDHHKQDGDKLSGSFNKLLKKKNKKPEKEIKPASVKLVSLDIGTRFTKIVEGRFKNGSIYINNMYKVPTKEKSITDGVLEETNILSMYLQGALKDKKVKTKNVAFVSSSSTIISRELVLPYVDDQEEFKNLVTYEIQQFLFINLNNYEVQYMIIDSFEENNVEKVKVLAIIYPKNMVNKYRNLSEKMMLNPYSLDITNNCVRKVAAGASFFNADLIDGDAINMYLDIGASTIDISIVNRGKLDFIRVLPMGGNEINEVIMELKGVSASEAEQLKLSMDSLVHSDKDRLAGSIERVVEEWVNNINRIIQFYASKSSGKNIKHIYIYGGTSRIKGLCEYFEVHLGIPTTRIMTIDNLEFSSNVKVQTVEEYVNAIGALIRL